MTADDLQNYRAIERAPVRGSYRGYDIVSMPPPSSGGVALIEMLNILEGYDLGKLGPAPSRCISMIEAMKRAYADRAVFLGDPDSVKMPIAGLTSKPYAATLRAQIGDARHARGRHPPRQAAAMRKAATPRISPSSTATATRCRTPTRSISPTASAWSPTAPACCSTTSSTISPPSRAPPTPTACVGFDANLPGPNKRPLSSMTPTIVLKDGKPVLITGSPGGSRIITAVLQVIVNVIDFRMPIARRGRRAAPAPSMAAGPGVRRAGLCARRARRAARRAATPSCRPSRTPRPIPSRSPPAAMSASPTRAPAARWRPVIEAQTKQAISVNFAATG